MPRHKTSLIFILLLASFFLTTCKKRWFDDRNKYIGDWNMKVIRINWENGRNPMYIVDTTEFIGKVSYINRHAFKGTLRIEYSKGVVGQFNVNSEGVLSACDTVGTITSTQLTMMLDRYNSCSTALGSGTNYTVTASKN